MVALTVISLFLIPKVKINNDLTKYLPDDSSMKKGIDLMEQEFPDMEEVYTIRIMFKDLPEAQKNEIKTQIEAVPNVSGVEFEEGNSDYNKGEYTLYYVTTEFDYDSEEEAAIEENLAERFADYDVTIQNDDTISANIPTIVLILAFAVMIVILLIACNSFFEPILFLITIGIAILLNLGTNIILGEISDITYGIAAVLQLVLSMDYSIILMNRYRQELEKTSDRKEAMTNALTAAFSSIIGSSVTTIVGLLVLLFMSFKIGADLGIVLAKGVALSLISVFTVLPPLILLFHKPIMKTTKKTRERLKNKKGPLGALGGFSFRFHKVIAIFFVLLFAGTYILQTSTQIAYTIAEEDKIADIFGKRNQLVMLYKNDDEQKTAKLAEKLESNPNVTSVTSYATTLGKKYTAEEMADVVEDFGSDMKITPEMLELIYYDYYKKGETTPLPMSTFINFIADDIAKNETFSGYIDADVMKNIDNMKKFADRRTLTKAMSIDELAGFFGMSSDDVKQLLLYYYIQKGGMDTGSMTLPVFADFVVNELAADRTYSSMIDSASLSQMQKLKTFTDVQKMTTPCGYKEMASLLGIEEESARMLYIYYYAMSESNDPGTMTLPEFTAFLKNEILPNPVFSAYFDDAAKAQLEQLAIFTDVSVITKQLSPAEIAVTLGMDETMVNNICGMFFMQNPGRQSMSLMEFTDFVINVVAADETYAAMFDEATLAQLKTMQQIMQVSAGGVEFTYNEMGAFFGMDTSKTKMLFTYNQAKTEADSWKLSPQTVVNFITANSEQFESSLGSSGIAELNMLKNIIDGSVSGTQYRADALALLLGTDSKQTGQIYLLYMSRHGDTGSWNMSVQQFVDFINSDVLSSNEFADRFSASDADSLRTAKKIIDAVVSQKTYTSAEMSDLLGGVSADFNSDSIELIYLYYAGIHNSDPSWTLSIDTMFDYVSNSMLNDSRFKSMIDNDMRAEITKAKGDLEEGIKQLKGSNYSMLVLTTTLPEESAQTTAFLEELDAECRELTVGNYYLVGNSSMVYEMQNSFDKELLIITLLTALSIFIVVAITFRSLAIPLILVLIVQCGVFITSSVIGLQGNSIFYLALLIVECILMGATIDYGILFTNYYREMRQTMDVKEALIAAYKGSIHTILTSGSIMVFVTAIIGPFYGNPTVEQIISTLSIGCLSAIILILFILPGILVLCDRWVIKKTNKKHN